MKNVSRLKPKLACFEASYSIQLSYGCALPQVAKFIAVTLNNRKKLLYASFRVISAQIRPFWLCRLWEICGERFGSNPLPSQAF